MGTRLTAWFSLPLILLASCLTGCQDDLQGPAGLAISEASLSAIEAAGWINGEAPTAEELRGQIVVVDCWATWCGPCAMAAPSLVRTYLDYRDRGVQFIGLTGEPATELPEIRAFVDRFSTNWPIGYGANRALSALGVRVLPTLIIFDRQGQVAHTIVGFKDDQELPRLLDQMLAQ